MKKPKPRGYDQGGSVGSFAGGIASGMQTGLRMASLLRSATGSNSSSGAVDSGTWDTSAKGGKIKRTHGPKMGKDDGLISAQKGEYVVRKSAVKKLGTRALDQVNKGKLPPARGR